jgi:hypothetical protein
VARSFSNSSGGTRVRAEGFLKTGPDLSEDLLAELDLLLDELDIYFTVGKFLHLDPVSKKMCVK